MKWRGGWLLAAALVLAGDAVAGPPHWHAKNKSRRPLSATNSPAPSWGDLYNGIAFSTIELAIPGQYLQHYWKEDKTLTALTHPAADGDTIGQVDDPGPSAHILEAETTATKPTLSTQSGVSCINFASASSQRLKVRNSADTLNWLANTTVGTVAFKVWKTTAAAAGPVSDSINALAVPGMDVEFTAADKLLIRLGTSGSVYSFNYTTTAGLASGQWYSVVIRFNAASGMVVKIGSAGEESSARLNAGALGSASGDLTFGMRTGGTQPVSMCLADYIITNDRWSDAQRDWYIGAYAPVRDSGNSLVRQISTTLPVFNFARTFFNFTNSATLFQDTGGTCTTAVSANNDPVGCVVDPRDPTRHWKRNATASAVGLRPLWQTGSAGGLKWDGIDDKISFASTANGGARTLVFTGQQNDTTLGSNWWGDGLYSAASGASYVNNSCVNGGPGAPYESMHLASGSVPTSLLKSPTGWNIYEDVRDTTNVIYTRTSKGGIGPFCNGFDSQFTNTSNWTVTNLGGPSAHGAGWELDGQMTYWLEYTAGLNAAQRDQIADAIYTLQPSIP